MDACLKVSALMSEDEEQLRGSGSCGHLFSSSRDS